MERHRCHVIMDVLSQVSHLPCALHHIIASYACWVPHLIIPQRKLSYDMVSTHNIEELVALQMGECFLYNTEINTLLWERLCEDLRKKSLSHNLDLLMWYVRISTLFLHPTPKIPVNDDIGMCIWLFMTQYKPQYLLDVNIAAVVLRSDVLEFLLERGAVINYLEVMKMSKPPDVYCVIRQYLPQTLADDVNTQFDRMVEWDPELAHILMHHPQCVPRITRPDLFDFQLLRIQYGAEGNVPEDVLIMYTQLTTFMLCHNPRYASTVKAFSTGSNPLLQEIRDYALTIPEPPSSSCQIM